MTDYQQQILSLLQEIAENTRPKTRAKTSSAFQKPTLDEVKAYIQEKGSPIDPEAFYNHYEANNWYRGKTKIKNWKACVTTWEKSLPKEKQVDPEAQKQKEEYRKNYIDTYGVEPLR